MSKTGFEKMLDKLSNEVDVVLAVVMAIVLSYLRILVDNPNTAPLRIIVETLTCAFLTLAATFLIAALHYDMRIAVFIGACIGYLGPTTIRIIALRFINRKL